MLQAARDQRSKVLRTGWKQLGICDDLPRVPLIRHEPDSLYVWWNLNGQGNTPHANDRGYLWCAQTISRGLQDIAIQAYCVQSLDIRSGVLISFALHNMGARLARTDGRVEMG